MNLPDIYVVESIERRDGNVHERFARRQGHRVRILRLAGGVPLLAEYIDEVDMVLRTSLVSDWVRSDERLIVWTRNSVYKFRKVNEEVVAE